MTARTARRRRPLLVAVAALSTACLGGSLLVAVPAQARPLPTGGGELHLGRSTGVLSARLLALAEPATARSSARSQALALSLPAHGPGSVVRDAGGRVLVQVRLAETAAATVAPLRLLGEVVNVSGAMSRATLRVAPNRLTELAGTPGVLAADLIPAPISGTAHGSANVAASTAGDCRSVVSEADVQLRAAQARMAAGVDGTGVKVGVLSDSYDVADEVPIYAAHDVASGDLPGTGNPCGRTTPVQVLQELPATGGPGVDEGRAMLQLVHDIAPGSPLAFATAFAGPDQFAANIRALKGAGAKVIVDDVSYFTEPFFQSGVIDRAAADVTAQGVTYFSSAGNSNLILGGRDVTSWETPSTRLTPCPAVTDGGVPYPLGDDCVNFEPTGTADSGYEVTVDPDGVVAPVIQWAEPVNGVTTDFDAYLVDASGVIVAGHEGIQVGEGATGEPVEFFGWQNESGAPADVRLVIARYDDPDTVTDTGTPRLKVAFVQSDGVTRVEYDQSRAGDVVGPTIYGHNGGDAVVSVGAVPYDNASVVEDFSSRGPVTHYFGPVTGTTPAAPLPTAKVIAAPDLAATDGGATTFFGQQVPGAWRFYGTSAAAPGAAAVAALLRQREPSLTPAQVVARLTSTAVKVGTAPKTAVGAGLVDAVAAIPATSRPSAPVVTRTTASRGAALVSFTGAASTGNAPVTSYRATCTSSKGGVARSATRAGTSTAALRVTGLTPGVPYRCTVLATNAFRVGLSSAPGAVVVPTGTPGRPDKPTVKAGHKLVRVSFRAPANTGGLAITRYTVTCVPARAGKTRSKSGAATTLRVKRLKANATYRCTVVATNSLGTGPRSARSGKVRPRG